MKNLCQFQKKLLQKSKRKVWQFIHIRKLSKKSFRGTISFKLNIYFRLSLRAIFVFFLLLCFVLFKAFVFFVCDLLQRRFLSKSSIVERFHSVFKVSLKDVTKLSLLAFELHVKSWDEWIEKLTWLSDWCRTCYWLEKLPFIIDILCFISFVFSSSRDANSYHHKYTKISLNNHITTFHTISICIWSECFRSWS